MSIKINRLELENVKRIKAVVIEPTATGLTIVGGRNNQGKTTVLDSIAWALGGEKYRPSEPRRDGSVTPPSLHIELSNGLIVERKGKNSDLKVIDPSGNKAGQQLVNEFISQLALDLPKFLNSSGKDKAKTLLQIIGVGEQLYKLEQEEQQLYNRRLEIGRIADQKKKYAAELTDYPDAPTEPVSAGELIRQQQDILARNGENQRKREYLGTLERDMAEIEMKLAALQKQHNEMVRSLEIARMSAKDLQDESTAELEQNIANIDAINWKVRANMDRERAEGDAEEYSRQYSDLNGQIEQLRKDKIALLEGADLPLPGLSVADGELTYKGYRWDNMSASEQLMVAAAIVRKLNPDCGFVLLDKLEQMDLTTLSEFGAWLEAEGLQAIATRVSTGDECSVIISDGYGGDVPQDTKLASDFLDRAAGKNQEAPKWKAGEF